MQRSLGKAMQFLALVLLPVSMIWQLEGGLTSNQMLAALIAGFCLFYIGRIVEGYAPQ